MMVDLMSCTDVGPMLFDFKEGGCEVDVRRRIHAHLATCRECRDAERAEHELTSLLLLSSPRPPASKGRPVGTVLAATAAVVLGFVFLPRLFDLEAAAGASITRYEMTFDDEARADVRALGADELVEIAAGQFGAVDLEAAGSVSVAGPAVLAVRRVAGRWTVDLFRGDARIEVAPRAALTVRSRFGTRVLRSGGFALSAERASIRELAADQDEDARTPAELLRAGFAAFFEKEDMPEAERLFRKVVAAADSTADEVSRARFYMGAAMGRQGKLAETLEHFDAYLEDHPVDPGRGLILFFQGSYARALGQERRACTYWKTLLSEEPDSDLAKRARRLIGAGKTNESAAQRAPERAQDRSPNMRGVLEPGPEKPGGYLVVRTALDGREGFASVAAKIAKFHHADVVDFDGRNVAHLARDLKQRRPQYVLFVVPPDVLDVNLQRRVLLASYGLDDDVFADFSWGWFTARDAKGLAALWKRTRAAHGRKRAKEHPRWVSASVASGIKSTVYPGSIPAVARAAGFVGEHIYWSTVESDPKVLDFVDEHLPELEEADVVGLYGCGDPQGIWLFSDRRNMDRSKHWDYEPDEVGRDPEGEMPRIMASRFAGLKLASPVVWSGTCHSGAPERVFVEGDIVSTFGRTDAATLHHLAPENSLCLSIIDAGALAFLAPVAANHGMSASMEADFALIHGASLGETLKSTYDDVALAAGGAVVLDLVEDGKRDAGREYVMQGGGANRILIGDPSLRPFAETKHPGRSVVVKKSKEENAFDVVVTWEKGFQSHAWDIYRKERGKDGRVLARVDLEGLVPREKRLKFAATAVARGRQGNVLPYELTHCVPEDHHGRRYLHLQVNAPRTQRTVGRHVEVTFHVTW